MTLRRHPITGEPILFAPARADRPRAFTGEQSSERCPFCPGHEADTPPEIARVGDPWLARVVPNKFPPIEGAEVIVESAKHGARFDEIAHAERIVRLYVDRLRAHEDAAYAALFRNEGEHAGASIPHLHSQLVPVPFVPPRIAREEAGFAKGCPLCAIEGETIRETETMRWLAPHGSWMAYQQWIVPRRHAANVVACSDAEVADLAALLQSAARAMRGMAYNWMCMNFRAGHWYVDIQPRVTTLAGLELGTGTFVEIIDPAAAARRLRE